MRLIVFGVKLRKQIIVFYNVSKYEPISLQKQPALYLLRFIIPRNEISFVFLHLTSEQVNKHTHNV